MRDNSLCAGICLSGNLGAPTSLRQFSRVLPEIRLRLLALHAFQTCGALEAPDLTQMEPIVPALRFVRKVYVRTVDVQFFDPVHGTPTFRSFLATTRDPAKALHVFTTTLVKVRTTIFLQSVQIHPGLIPLLATVSVVTRNRASVLVLFHCFLEILSKCPHKANYDSGRSLVQFMRRFASNSSLIPWRTRFLLLRQRRSCRTCRFA